MHIDEVPDFLSNLRDESPDEYAMVFVTFEDLFDRKLWHELTDALMEWYKNPASFKQRPILFNNFVILTAEKINKLKLVQLALRTLEAFPDYEERRAFLDRLIKEVDKPGCQDAYVYALTALASLKLHQSDIDGAKEDLSKCENILDSFDSVDTSVHAAFYRTFADYHQVKHEFASYYKNALLYLACINVDELPLEERQRRAYDLSVAALVSDSIYNFGELLLHPILDALVDSEHSWLRELLFAFNRGDLGAYDVLSNNISKNDLLRQHQTFLHQKICLSALTEAVFRRAPHDRSMTFATIRDETHVQLHEIEHLIMKALSLGLLRGTIDQVAQVANINWVQPKVLDKDQVHNMRLRLREWDSSVNRLGTEIERAGKEIWVA